MLFKKITYQPIRNYELWKKKTQQKQNTKSKHQQQAPTASTQNTQEIQEWRKER